MLFFGEKCFIILVSEACLFSKEISLLYKKSTFFPKRVISLIFVLNNPLHYFPAMLKCVKSFFIFSFLFSSFFVAELYAKLEFPLFFVKESIFLNNLIILYY